jgi:hypothetical protein
MFIPHFPYCFVITNGEASFRGPRKAGRRVLLGEKASSQAGDWSSGIGFA